MAEIKPVESGQIYVAKPDVPQSQNKFRMLKIIEMFKDAENPQLENLWTAQILSPEGDWIYDSELNLIFSQMLETHYELHFDPMQPRRSRLDDLDA